MCKRMLFLLLPLAFLVQPAFADPLRITSGTFFFDIEGDGFIFNGDGFALRTTAGGIYTTNTFPGRCGDGRESAFSFCHEAEGVPSDWSFRTAGGEQLLGRGNVMLDGVNATNVDFVGTVQVNVVPTPVFSGGALEGFGVVAPFSFEAMIRGIQGGDELFARQFVGNGQFGVGYEQVSGRPGFVMLNADTDSIFFRFSDSAAPIPEPGTVLLLGSGLAAAVVRRRRRQA